MVSVSVLYERPEDKRRTTSCKMPAYFLDLNLDQIVDEMDKEYPDYGLRSIYYRPLQSLEEIAWRQEVFQDIEDLGLVTPLKAFSDRMQGTRRSLESLSRIYNPWHKNGWFLEAATKYRDGVVQLVRDLDALDLRSRALLRVRSYLRSFVDSDAFKPLSEELEELKNSLAQVHYTATLRGLTVIVRKYDGEMDYGNDIEETFSRFSQGSGKSYLTKYADSAGLDDVQGRILDCVSRLYPELFAKLDEFCKSWANFVDDTVDAFEREIRFYLAWLEYIAPLRAAGLALSLPKVSAESKAISAKQAFDAALAKRVVLSATPIVTNDFYLSGPERVIVVTGPNQGGKTTFARVYGQLFHLASLGCLVPAQEAQLFLFDHLYSHFEREETTTSQRGKLYEELLDIHNSLAEATSRSVLILNEVFTSTTLVDSIYLSRKVMDRVEELDCLCLCVTFLDELSSLGEKFVSYVLAVDPKDPLIRTFKVERRPADGLAYARSLAEKHRLTYDQLRRRIGA